MHRELVVLFLASFVLGACSSAQYVTGDSRGFFDTSMGLYGGNEFDARSPEGKITVANQPPAKALAPVAAAPVPSAAPQVQPAALEVQPVAPVAPSMAAGTPALATPVASTGGATAIAIGANAFDAVFGTASAPLQPTAEQLMRLDSLSLVAGEAARADLQQKILACRRAGDACRLSRN
jgi:hypothetical protein